MELVKQKIRQPQKFFNSIDNCQKPGNNLEEEEFFSILKNDCRSNAEIERTKNYLKNLMLKIKRNYQNYIWKVMFFYLHEFLKKK